MDLKLAARGKEGPEEYSDLSGYGLRAESIRMSEGFPSETAIRITADMDFSGIIRFAIGSAGNPASARFFLPGFMYGTNRGESPLVVDSKAPRLRMWEDFPASPWWMVRSDRLSHPCAMMFLDGRITGLAASPYYVRREGHREAWEPGITGEFEQYAGFGCSLERGEVWYTLGYENAPWMFVDSHHIQPRRAPGENCFSIQKGESVFVLLYCFDLPAEDEREIHSVLKWVYARYHESPRTLRSVADTVREISTAIMKDAWVPERHCYSGFVLDLARKLCD